MSAGGRTRVWGVPVWLGVLLGLAIGPVVSFHWNVHQGMGWWGTAVVTAACATAGGFVAGVCREFWEGRGRR